MKIHALAATLCLAPPGLLLFGQLQSEPPALSEYTVRGSVVDGATEQPITRALVQLAGDAVLTDNNGSFEFPDIPPGQQIITVRRPGYVTNQDQAGFQPSQNQISTFQISVRADTPSLTLPLTPEAIITGRLILPDSDSEDGIQVSAYRRTIENGRPKWQTAGFGLTNSEGIFRIASLPAGDYLLYTQPPPDFVYAVPDNKPSSGYSAVYFPGVAEASAAGTITLSPGDHKQADITLLRQTFYPVTVRVTNVQPGDSFNLEFMDSDGRPIQTPVRLDALQQIGHTFLPPGRYIITARIFDPGNIRTPLFARTEFTVTAAAAYVAVTAIPLRTIPVIVHKEFAAPLVQVIIYSGLVHNREVGLNLNLINASAEFPGGQGDYASGLEPVPGSDDDSSFQISNVFPGKYWVEAYPFQGYISSITSGGVDLTRDILNISAGSSAPIEITLRNDTGSIEGSVTSTQSESQSDADARQTPRQAWIYAVPLFNTIFPLESAQTDSSGKFSFSSLAPGSYRVIASDSPLQIEYHNPDTLSALSNKGQVVPVEPGTAAHVQLDIALPAEHAQ